MVYFRFRHCLQYQKFRLVSTDAVWYAYTMETTEEREARQADEIEAFRRYNEMAAGGAGESPSSILLVAAYDGKPKSIVEYWHDRASRAEARLEKYQQLKWWQRLTPKP